MLCPHCGKEIESSINNITLNGAAQPGFTWIPLHLNGTTGYNPFTSLNHQAPNNAAGGVNPTKLIFDVESGTWKTQE